MHRAEGKAKDAQQMKSRQPEKNDLGTGVIQFVVDAADIAFTPILPVDSLADAMCADPYVLGYVVARLLGLTACACASSNHSADYQKLMEQAAQRFLGAHYQRACSSMAALDEARQDRYRHGFANGQLHCEYLFGTRDIRQHADYRVAVARERVRSTAMPGRRFSGSASAIAHELEQFTFGRYLRTHHAHRMPDAANHQAQLQPCNVQPTGFKG